MIKASLPNTYNADKDHYKHGEPGCSTCRYSLTIKNHPRIKGCDKSYCNFFHNINPGDLPEDNNNWSDEVEKKVGYYKPLLTSVFGTCNEFSF